MKSLPATSLGNLIRMLCWLFIQMVLSIWTQLGGSHVKLYPLKTFIGPRAIYRNATWKIHKPCENRNGSKILQNPAKIPSKSCKTWICGMPHEKFTNPAKTEMVRNSFKILQNLNFQIEILVRVTPLISGEIRLSTSNSSEIHLGYNSVLFLLLFRTPT